MGEFYYIFVLNDCYSIIAILAKHVVIEYRGTHKQLILTFMFLVIQYLANI